MKNNSRRTVIVLGGSGGLGKEIAKRLFKHVDRVIATYNSRMPDIKKAEWCFFDAAKDNGFDQIKLLADSFSDKLVSFIFCIGIPSSKKLITETKIHEWNNLFNINCVSFVRSYLLFKNIIRDNKANVIVISSDTTSKINIENGPYTSSKMALESAAITLSKEEIKYGVRINIISPSLIESPLGNYILSLKGIEDKNKFIENLPLKRLLSVNDVSEIIVSIATNSIWQLMSGQNIRISNF